MERIASYTYLTEQEWDKRIARIDQLAKSCELCPRSCHVDRFAGKKGFCAAPGEMIVSSIFPHHGEEPPISGTGGSGTVFFSHCTLRCVFCQNHQISQLCEGRTYTPKELAERMVDLQQLGCHNINLVTASHFLPWIVRALKEASSKGLTIPLVYNCGGYESVAVVKLLSGIIDIYLPDMKYGDNVAAAKYSSAPEYVAVNQAAIREMFRQVGPLTLDNNGIACRGMCIRHLVLPGGFAGTKSVLGFLKTYFDPHDIFISLMAQYRPLHKASTYPEIDRTIDPDEYDTLKSEFTDAGFDGFYQEVEKMDKSFVIDFKVRKDQRLK